MNQSAFSPNASTWSIRVNQFLESISMHFLNQSKISKSSSKVGQVKGALCGRGGATTALWTQPPYLRYLGLNQWALFRQSWRPSTYPSRRHETKVLPIFQKLKFFQSVFLNQCRKNVECISSTLINLFSIWSIISSIKTITEKECIYTAHWRYLIEHYNNVPPFNNAIPSFH